MPISKSKILLTNILFIEGFVSIAIEILAIRQLVPFVGTNVVVTSLVIGIFLLFLAFGYWQGGRLQSNLHDVLQRNFFWAALFTGIGLSYLFLTLFFTLFTYSPTNNALIVLTIYLLLIIAPLVYLLGQTIPVTMNLVRQNESAGLIGGKVLFLNTIGSFLGAILTTLFLLAYFGVGVSLFINFCLLGFLIFLINIIAKTKKSYFYFFLFSIIIVYLCNIFVEKNYFLATDNYANYKTIPITDISSNNKGIILQINESFSSFIDKEKHGFPYIELIKRILFQDLNLQNKKILVLGAGGFTLSAENTHNNYFTYVDIDAKIKTIVTQNFLAKINGQFIAEDARTYVRNNKLPYDVIVSDVYSSITEIPAELLTKEHFANIKKNIVSGGYAIFNIIANPFFADNYSKRVDSTLRYVFKNCVAIPLKYANEMTNIIYICKIAATEKDTNIYADEKNTIDLDLFTKSTKH